MSEQALHAGISAYSLDPDIRIERLEDLSLAFHRQSGETHVLAADTDIILSTLGDNPLSAQDIAARLVAEHGALESEDGDPLTLIEARLQELHRLGIALRRLSA
ncbi:MAG: HPr-rel-A system PqqD family peptide chaperone [Pseudomonadota bacterium]